MKIGIILETKEAEKSWNAMRFANTALARNHEVKVFLMGEAVEIESINEEPFNTLKQLTEFQEKDGIVLACGTCLTSRKMDNFETCSISTMHDAVELVEWADKVVNF